MNAAIHTRWERAPSIRFSRGMCYVAFSLGPAPSLFVFISSGPAVICCDKAASTGDARVSRVEGHASVRRRALSSTLPRKKGQAGYDIFVIMLLDTCPSVTTAPGNKLPVDLSFLFFFPFFTLWPCARTYNTSRRTEWESCRTLRALCIYGWKRRRKRDLYATRANQRSSINRLNCFVVVSIVSSSSACRLQLGNFKSDAIDSVKQ